MRQLKWPSWFLWKTFTDGEPIPLPTLAQYSPAQRSRRNWLRMAEYLPIVAIFFTGFYMLRFVWRFVPEALLLIVILPVPLFLILYYTSLLPGLDLILQLSNQIHNDQLNGRFELLSIQPHGARRFYAAWTLYHYRHDRINRLARMVMRRLARVATWITVFGLFPVIFLLLLRDTLTQSVIDPGSTVHGIFSFILANSSSYLVFALILALLIFTAFTLYLQSSVSSVLVSRMLGSMLTTTQHRLSRWVMILGFAVYQLVFHLLPLVLLTVLIATQVYELTLGYNVYDPYAHIGLMNAVTLLLFGTVVVNEIGVVVLWRWSKALSGDDPTG